MTQREHIVTLPDSYIGSADSATDTLSIVNPTGDQIRECTASYNRGLYKIVDELFVNAWDQKVRIDGENAQLAKANKSKSPWVGPVVAASLESFYRSALQGFLITILQPGTPLVLFPNMQVQIPTRVVYITGLKQIRLAIEENID